MDKNNFILNNENGAVLLTALMIVLIVTLIALSLNNTTTTDIIIASNDKNYKIAFYNSDSGTIVSATLLEAFFIEDFEGGNLPDHDDPDDPDSDKPIKFSAASFKEKILSKSKLELDGGTYHEAPKETDTPDIIVKDEDDLTSNMIESFVKYQDRKHLAGSEKSFQFLYDFYSEGTGPGSSSANIKARYRHIEHF